MHLLVILYTNETPTKIEGNVEEESFQMKQNGGVAFNEVGFVTQSFKSNNCSKFDFVTKSDYEVDVFILSLSQLSKSSYFHKKGKVKLWRINKEYCKSIDLSKARPSKPHSKYREMNVEKNQPKTLTLTY